MIALAVALSRFHRPGLRFRLLDGLLGNFKANLGILIVAIRLQRWFRFVLDQAA